MAIHNGMKFSTKDNDQDTWANHCAQRYQGAWWFHACHAVNLNGLYGYGINDNTGNQWYGFKRSNSLRASKMMIRKKVD